MIVKCTSCAAPIDLSQWPAGQHPTEVTCSSCGALVALNSGRRAAALGPDLLATDQNTPRFQPATSTLDAPAPDDEVELEPAMVDATRRPRDVLMAPNTQPLDRPLPLGDITATSTGRKPPPLPGQRPTATTMGMPAPSMVGRAIKKDPPALPGQGGARMADASGLNQGPQQANLPQTV